MCRECGEEVLVDLTTYKRQNNFHCKKHKHSKPKGEDSVFYKRELVQCSNCGKEIMVIPYDAEKKNGFGDNHNFCCQECYWEFRSKYYVGDKSAMKGYKFTPNQLEEMKVRLAKRKASENRLNTSIQKAIDSLLDDINEPYEREKVFSYYCVDNYLISHNLIIEVMGDYWHGNPLTYNGNGRQMNKIQQKTILKDKQKEGYIQKHYNIHILYIWETDIKKRILLCKMLIEKYIASGGNLSNYNSFNYIVEDGELFLNENPILAYQEMPSENYLHLIKN